MRSSVVIASISIGLTGGILFMGIMNALTYQRINSAIKTEISHIQIHNEKFLENEELEYSIYNSDKIIKSLEDNTQIKALSGRIITMGMAATARTSTGVKIIGVYPEKEARVTNLHSKVIDSLSSYLNSKYKLPIFIGEKLAEKLKAKRKDKIILTFQSKSGQLTGGQFKIVGIFKTTNSIFDEMSVFVRKKDIAKLTDLPISTIHEIAILLKDDVNVNAAVDELRNEFPKLTILAWHETMPMLGILVESMNYMLYIFMGIILLAVAFGIVNTMLMAVLERSKELGMLMCIGLNKRKVFCMILIETILLSMTGGLIGLFSAALILNCFSKSGINLSIVSKGLEVWGYDTIIYPYVDGSFYLAITAMVVIIAILSALYPARRAIRLNPVEAIRIDA